MSAKIAKLTKEAEGEYKVPTFKNGKKVWNANWHDDVDVPETEETNVINFKEKFEFFSNEKKYQNDPSDDEEGVEARIAEFKRKKELGQKVINLYSLEKVA